MLISNVSFGDRCGNGEDWKNLPTGGGEPAIACSRSRCSERKLKQMYEQDSYVQKQLTSDFEKEPSKFQKLINSIKTKFSK